MTVTSFHFRPRLATQEEIERKMVGGGGGGGGGGAFNKTHHVTNQLTFNLSSSSSNYLVGLSGGSDTPDLKGSLAGQSTMEMPGIDFTNSSVSLRPFASISKIIYLICQIISQ